MKCITSKRIGTKTYEKHRVTVNVEGQEAKSQQAFSYRLDWTPYIKWIEPSSIAGDTVINIIGHHRIPNLQNKDVEKLLIGNTNCLTENIEQDKMNGGWRTERLKCKTFKDQEAGEYSYTEHLTYGLSQYSIATYKTSLYSNKNYMVRIQPKI